ncbi:MAG: HD domain-containing protein [Deltaproteobacteria bacterium]|nr:HD domain-containing protein [Deltaproteobacteria bacterium]
MKKIFINDLTPGAKVDDAFVLSEKNIAQKKDGNNFLHVAFSDKTGKIKGVVWNNVENMIKSIKSGDFVHVKGNVSEYKDSLQLVVKSMEYLSEDSVEPADFLPVTCHDIEKMFDRIKQITFSIETDYIKELFEAFWNDQDFVNKFKIAPAAKRMHHAYIGGLLEHSLSMAILVKKIAGHYGGINQDLLLAGAILHDIGKIREFDYKTKIDYSDEGRMLNHIVIGIQMVHEKIGQIKNFPEEDALLLKHMVASHHGIREFGSPEPPKTVEAVLLNYVDEIDSKINGIRNFISSADQNEAWTPYHNLLGRHFYIGKKG